MVVVNKRTDIRYILHFFDKPAEPCFMPKGYNKDVFYDIPDSYIPLYFQKNYEAIKKRREHMGSYYLVEMPEIPANEFEIDLEKLRMVTLHENFTSFIKVHNDTSAYVISKLYEVKIEYLISACAKLLLLEVNPHLFQYALSVTINHRPETHHLRIPNNATQFPELYFTHDVIQKAKALGTIARELNEPEYVPVARTATDKYIENRIAYFREDIGVNLHHWHWHIIYPFEVAGANAMKIVGKDRRGELFYYMHQQILARYDAERLSNKLARVIPYQNIRESIAEPYFPKLTSYTSANWASRHEHANLKDVNREASYSLLQVELWRDRIFNAIHLGVVYNNEKKLVPLDEKTGIDVIGNLVESSILSTNRDYYGYFHNAGHVLVSSVHDPDNRYLEYVGVMGDNRTACRDPMFYRWHKFVDDIFNEYKKTLKPYTKEELTFDGVEVSNVSVYTLPDSKLNIENELKNILVTYIQRDKLNLAYGIYIDTPGPVYALFEHLQNREFYYRIRIKNTGPAKTATVRIFLAPHLDEDNKPFHLGEQRRLYIELDRFIYSLKENDNVVISRSSGESSVTIPFKQLFDDVNEVMENLEKGEDFEAAQKAYCGCGWPAHLLVPKGEEKGAEYDLFVMVTNYEDDKVVNGKTLQETMGCSKVASFSYCGLKDQKYPDSKPMGFPFDRAMDSTITINEFAQTSKSMKVQKVKIVHKDITLNGDSIGDINVEAMPMKQ